MVKNKHNLIVMALFSFGINAFWAVENFVINLYWTKNIDPHAIYIGLMVSVTAIVGVGTQTLFGAISDSSTSKYGRRRPLILIGSIAGGISMFFFPVVRTIQILFWAVLYGVIIDAIITFFGDLTTPTRLALLAESTDLKDRGKANALLGFMGGLGLFCVVAVSGVIIEFAGPDFGFYFGGISLIIGGVILFIFIHDPPVKERESTWVENFKQTFTMESYRENKSLYRLILFIFIIYMGVQMTAPFMFIYIELALGVTGLELAFVLGGMLLIAFVLTIPISILLDKFGRKPIMYMVAIGGVIASFTFTFVPANVASTFVLILIFGGLTTGFSSAVGSISETWMQDLAPEDRKGSMLSYKIVAIVIPMAPGALIGGLIADYGPKPVGFIYSPLMFIISAIIMLCSIPVLRYVEETLKNRD
jgi:Na+/melibiose symporter-like transporter